MSIEVPFFKQENDYTCGPTVLRMVMDYYGKPLSLEEINGILNTDPIVGTSNADMVSAARDLGFRAYSKENAKIADINKFLNKKIPVIVGYIEHENNEGHYALVVDMKHGFIILHDPYHGEKFIINIEDFESRWRSGFENSVRWMLVVTPSGGISCYLKDVYDFVINSIAEVRKQA